MPHKINTVFPFLGFSIFCATAGIGIITPLLPLYADSVGATGTWLGIIVAVYSIARILIIPFIGRLSDLRGKKVIMVIGLLFLIVSSISYIWAKNIPGLIMVRLLHGVAAGMIMTTAQAYIGDIIPAGEEGKWMGYYNITFITGFACGPLMGGLLTDYLGMNAAFYSMAVCSLLGFLGVVIFVPESVRREKEVALTSSFREIAASRAMWGICSARMGVSWCRGIIISFLPILAAVYIGLSPSQIGVLLTANALATSVVQIPAGRLSDRFSRRILVVAGGFLLLTSMALIPPSGSFWWLLAIFLLFSVGDAGIMTSASAMVVTQGKIYGMGMAMAMFNLAVGMGQAVSPILGGVVADSIGINPVFYMGSVFMLLCIGAFGFLAR